MLGVARAGSSGSATPGAARPARAHEPAPTHHRRRDGHDRSRVVTAVPTPTDAGVDLPGNGRPTVHLGDMNTPEQFIIGAALPAGAEHAGLHGRCSTATSAPPTSRVQALQQRHARHLPGVPRRPGTAGRRTCTTASRHLHGVLRRRRRIRAPPRPHAARRRPRSATRTASPCYRSTRAENHVYSIARARTRRRRSSSAAPLEFQQRPDGLPALEHALRPAPRLRPADRRSALQYWWLDTGNVQAAYVHDDRPAARGRPTTCSCRTPSTCSASATSCR